MFEAVPSIQKNISMLVRQLAYAKAQNDQQMELEKLRQLIDELVNCDDWFLYT
jgi:FMN-dependent NADH-azoreductase